MSNTIGNVKDLNASRTEALQGLLRSLGHTSDDSSESSGVTLSTEQLQKLSEKVMEILGDGEDRGLTPGDQPSQLPNEYGLPIVDISEPVDEDFQAVPSSLPVPEQDLTPLSLLPPEERERRRRERDRILDLLEEEERLQQLQEERDAEEERQEAIRKRKESAKAELDQLKAARKLQKKMGQALVWHAKGTEENGQGKDARSKAQTTSSVAKKSVSFADMSVVTPDKRGQQIPIHQYDWGDVTPGRLRAQSRAPLVPPAEAQKYPMKMHVMERRPAATPNPSFHDDADSDDESISSAGHISSHPENDHSIEDGRSSSSNNNLSDDELLEEGFDYDAAQHHREIALEYHEKRRAIGAEAAKAMGSLTFDDHDQQETSDGQLPLSRFRADRMAAAYDRSHNSVSTSIGQTVIPASRQKSLRKSVRLGTLENNQLVGEKSGESGSEDETIREVIQMLQTGNVQNVGADFKPSSMSTITTPRNCDAMESPPIGTPTAARGAKPSKFKVARGGDIAETTTFQENNSSNNTKSRPAISGVVERKAPRSFPGQHFPVNKPVPRPPGKISEPVPPMIIDSPSFPLTPGTLSSSPSHPVTVGFVPSHKSQHECPPSIDPDPSAGQDSVIQSQVPIRDPSSVERRVSKFMTERNTTNN